MNSVLRTFRPSFLILTPVCVFLGLSASLATGASINHFVVFLVLAGAVAAHISVNTLNEYYDFRSGLDLHTVKTPFSGGSGALPAHPGLAGPVLVSGLVSLVVTIVIGVYLALGYGTRIMPFGLMGVALIISYTQWLNRFPVLCLVAPGLGFGVLMVVGTHIILTGEHAQLPWLVSLVPFLLVNNLLLLNQYPDMEADVGVGRKTFPIAFGVKKSNAVYALFMLLAYVWVLLLVVRGYIPALGLVALVPLLFSLYSLAGAIKYAAEIGAYPRYMGANVAAAVLTPLLLGVAMVYG